MNKERSAARKKWQREISAGGVVYKKEDGQIFVLLIQGRQKNFGPPSGKWAFPKGWVGDHAGEKPEETALREVREEGGVEAKIAAKLGASKYVFRWQGENIFKIVQWYLMEYVAGDPADHDEEVAEARWVEAAAAANMLTFAEDKTTLQKALTILKDLN